MKAIRSFVIFHHDRIDTVTLMIYSTDLKQ